MEFCDAFEQSIFQRLGLLVAIFLFFFFFWQGALSHDTGSEGSICSNMFNGF